jgi:hypothetical protein
MLGSLRHSRILTTLDLDIQEEIDEGRRPKESP